MNYYHFISLYCYQSETKNTGSDTNNATPIQVQGLNHTAAFNNYKCEVFFHLIELLLIKKRVKYLFNSDGI